MKLLIDSRRREVRKVYIFSDQGREVASIEGGEEILKLIDRVLKKSRLKLQDLTEVSAFKEGESRVGINIGLAAANTLNYSLGLKKIDQLDFPANDGRFK